MPDLESCSRVVKGGGNTWDVLEEQDAPEDVLDDSG